MVESYSLNNHIPQAKKNNTLLGPLHTIKESAVSNSKRMHIPEPLDENGRSKLHASENK